MQKPNILIIEDDKFISELIELYLQYLGYSVAGVVDNADSVLDQLSAVRPDLALMDVEIKGSIGGIELAQILRQQYSIPVVFMTSHSDALTVQKAVATEPFGYLIKPVDRNVLAVTLQTALGRARSERNLARAEQTLTATLDMISDAAIVLDGNYLVVFMNSVAERLTASTRKEAIGLPVTELLIIASSDSLQIVPDIIEATLREGTFNPEASVNFRLRPKIGGELAVHVSANPIRGRNSKLVGLVLVLREVVVKPPGSVDQ